MKKKNIKSMLVSWMLVLSMVGGLFAGLSFESSAKEESSYREYTFLDFGISDATYKATQVKENAVADFDGFAFSGKLNVQANSTESGLVFTPSTGAYGTSLMFRSSTEGALYLINSYHTSDADLLVGWNYLELGFSSVEEMYQNPFDVRMTFDKTEDYYNLQISVNGVKKNTKCTTSVEDAKHFVLWAGEENPAMAQSVFPDYYTEYTYSDFGFADGAYAELTQKRNVTNGYEKIAVTGSIKYSTEARGLLFAENDNSFYSFAVMESSGNIWLWNYMSEKNTALYTHSHVSYNQLGYASAEEMYQSYISIRMLFDKENTDYKLRVILNEKVMLTTYLPASEMDQAKNVYMSSGVTIASDTTWADSYTEYTFSDFGIADGTYESYQNVLSAMRDYNGIAVTGKVCFQAGTGANNGISFYKDGYETGLNIMSTADGTIWIQNCYGNTYTTHGISYNELGYSSLEAMQKDDVKVRVRFDKTANGYRVITTLNDTLTKITYTPDTLTDAKNFAILATGAHSVTVKSDHSYDATYTEHTFESLGIDTGSYIETQVKENAFSVMDGMAFTGTLAFTEGSGNTGIVFTSNTGSYNILNIFDDGTEGKIWIQNYAYGDCTFGVSYSDLGFATKEAFYGASIKVRICVDKIDTDYRMIVTLNDVVTKITYCPAETFEDARHFILWAQAGRPIEVRENETQTTAYTEYTFSDVGIEDGIYTYGNLKSWDISTLDKKAFTANVLFSAGGETGFGFSKGEGSWSGFRYIIANESLYVQDYIGHSDFSIGYQDLGFTSAEELVSAPMKIRTTFDISGTDLIMTATVNDTYTKKQTLQDASQYESIRSVLVYGTEDNPTAVASDVGETEPEEPEQPLEILNADFNSFGMPANKIMGMNVLSTKVPGDRTTLDRVDFTGYLSYTAQAESDYFAYGVKEDKTGGIKFFWSGDMLWVYDQTGGYKGVNDDGCFFGKGYEALGLTAAMQEVKIHIQTRYTDAGVELTITVGTYSETFTIEGYEDYLGTHIFVNSATGTITYRSNTEETYEPDTILETAGYKRITVADFDGLGYGTYKKNGENTSIGSAYSADTLDMTYLDVDVQYAGLDAGNPTAFFVYGFKENWDCIQMACTYTTEGYLLTTAYLQGNKDRTIQAYGMTAYTDTINIKIAYRLQEQDGKTVYQVRLWINGIQVTDQGVTKGEAVGNNMVVYTPGTTQITFVAPSITTVNQDRTAYDLRDYDQTTATPYFVSGNATVTKNGQEVALTDHQITDPGDYTITTHVSSTAHDYIREVALYILGDVDLDGTPGTANDVEALRKLIGTDPVVPDAAAKYAADIDNSGSIDQKDLQLLESVAGNSDACTTLIKKYHVPAKTYDYLGGNEVMPIVGYYGPYVSDEKDYLTDAIYQKIKNSGVNMVNHSINDAGGVVNLTRKAMTLADKHHLGWFVDDYQLNDSQHANTLTSDALAGELGKYGYFESFLGIHIADEPSYKGASEGQSEDRYLEYFTGLSSKLNGYSNVTGFINMVAEDARTVNEYSTIISSYRKKDCYDAYWKQYMENANPTVISADDYPINNGTSEDATKAGGYFRTLGTLRNMSLQYEVPFWSYVQAGGNFDDDSNTKNDTYIASEAETYWNVNTALAFGAKGIEWFPLIQPTNFDGTGEAPVDRNGILLSDGTESTYYTWVKNANKQIAAVDEVLMKATSTAIVASGGYAESQAKGTVNSKKTTDVKTSYGKLKGVATTRTKYGALVGCFHYRDTEAFYVVNYDVEEQATITLTFDQAYHASVIQDGTAYGTMMTGATLKLTLPAGKGALVVLGTGDLNDDGKVSASDIVRMKKIAAYPDVYRALYAGMADMDHDAVLKKEDMDLFRKYLLAWQDTSLPG